MCALLATSVAVGCTATEPTAAELHEDMPAPASIWLTADPAAPSVPVDLEVRTAPHDEFIRQHTFDAGQPIRGSIPLGEGGIRLVALEGACSIDLLLEPERETDVIITVAGARACSFAIDRTHRSAEIVHPESGVLVAPNESPRIE